MWWLSRRKLAIAQQLGSRAHRTDAMESLHTAIFPCGCQRLIGATTPRRVVGRLRHALAGVDVAVVERRTSQDLVGSRSGGLHSRTIEVFDQRGIADRFLSEGKKAQTV